MSTLRTGYTTGLRGGGGQAAVRCSRAAAEAGEWRSSFPAGRGSRPPLVYARSTEAGAEAAVRKDAGDDPDVTNGALILASVAWSEGKGVEFSAGDGVGTVTKRASPSPPANRRSIPCRGG